MKIALVSPYDYPFPGGVTEHISHLQAEYARRGHDVKIIAPSSNNENQFSENVYRIGGVVPVQASGSVARITLAPSAYRWVKAILSRERFDVVHLHEPLMPVLGLVTLRHSKSVNVGTFHAYRESNFAYQAGKTVLRRFMGRLHGRIAVSPPARELVSRYFPGDYEIIPNGIDVKAFDSDRITPIQEFVDGRVNVLFVGRLEKRKGLRHLLQAWSALVRQYPSTRLIVVGEGELREESERYVLESGLTNVVFTGFVPNSELPRYYRTADIFCAPSTGFESQGIVLLEAMAAGRPIAASSIAGYASVVTNGREGLLVPPEDHASLAVALASLVGDAGLRAAMAARGRETVLQYDWEKVAQRVLDYYAETIERTTRRAHLRGVLKRRS